MGATQLQVRRLIRDEKPADFPYCKHFGAELSEGQSICHVCRKKVDQKIMKWDDILNILIELDKRKKLK